jgi:TRAP-type uncharacterized transport system substrate-binding protein
MGGEGARVAITAPSSSTRAAGEAIEAAGGIAIFEFKAAAAIGFASSSQVNIINFPSM